MEQKVLLRFSQLDGERVLPIALAEDILSADELSRAAKFRFQPQRKRYLRGRAFVRMQLGSYLGIPGGSLRFRYAENGKPFLSSGPFFNFSRSGPLGVLAFSDTAPVGVDLEHLSRDLDPNEVAEDCLSRHELALLSGLNGEARKERFLVFWTAKEARMKLTGEGMALAPSSIRLKLENGWPVSTYEPSSSRALAFKHVKVANALCCIATTVSKRNDESAAASPFAVEYDSVGPIW